MGASIEAVPGVNSVNARPAGGNPPDEAAPPGN